ENRSDILFNYADAVFGGSNAFFDFGGGASIGVQSAPGLANSFSFFSPSLDNNVALLWTMTGPNSVPVMPTMSSISPNSTSTAAAFVLTVNGANFTSDTRVLWNGSDRPTTFVNSNQLTASISAADVSTSGQQLVSVFSF